MTILLDTHIVLWAVASTRNLTTEHAAAIQDPTNTIYVSPVSMVEIVIKSSIGKLSIDPSLEEDDYRRLFEAFEECGFELIDYRATDAAYLRRLPFHHRDPFDRMIIAQAINRGYTVITADAQFRQYPVKLV